LRVKAHAGAKWWMCVDHCRPVEPPVVPDLSTMGVEVVSCIGSSVKRPVETPVVKDSFTTESNCPETPDSSSEPIQVGNAVRFVLPGHKHHGTEGTIVLIEDSSERRYSFESNCGHIKGLCTIAELERIDKEFQREKDLGWCPVSDPPQVGDAVVVVERSHKWRGVRGRIVSVSESNEYPLEFISDCGKRLGYFRLSSLKRIDKADPINPSHYKQGGIECIEAIKAATGDGFIVYVWGNVLKYLWRWPKKGGVDDLKKARWYLDRLIEEVGE